MIEKIGLLFSIFCWGQAFAAKPNDVVATVNGEKILYKEYKDHLEQSLLFVSNRKVTKEQALFDLINKRLGVQRAKELGLDQDPVVKSKIEDILYHALISKDLKSSLKEINVDEADVKKYYKNHKEYRTAHILFRLPTKFTEKELQSVYNKARDVYEEVIEKPDQFAVLANKYSQSSVATVGGDLGYQPPTSYAPEYFEAISGKKPGSILKPVQTQFGFHVIKIVDVRDYKDINKELYKKIVYAQKREKIMEDYFAKRRKKEDVKINKKLLQ